jgi:hypothetical protein
MVMDSNIANYRIWYSNLEPIYEMMKIGKNRELAVINPFKKSEAIRCIRVDNAQQFMAVLKWINFDKRTWNFYYSLAKYKNGIPKQTFNMEERDNTAWNKEHWKEIESFDFLIDFDCNSHEEIEAIKPEVKAVSDLLCNIPHSIRYSGMGYHIVIPGEYMPKGISFDPEAKNNYFDFLYELLLALKKHYCDWIDTGCHDPRRVVKIPYSLALYEDENYVCWPLRTHKELELSPNHHLTSNVLASYEPIRNRGLPLLNLEKTIDYIAFKRLLGAKYKRFIKNDKKSS